MDMMRVDVKEAEAFIKLLNPAELVSFGGTLLTPFGGARHGCFQNRGKPPKMDGL